MDFKIGDRVVALMDYNGGYGYDIIKGTEYTIMDTTTCDCGIKCVNVGVGNNISNVTRCPCGNRISGLGIWWVNSKRFTKVDDESVDVSEFMDVFTQKEKEFNN